MPVRTIEVRVTSRSLQAGDKMLYIGDYYLVKDVRIIHFEDADYIEILCYDLGKTSGDTFSLHYKPDQLRTVRREIVRTCEPCYDTDCECIWDQVNG